jgi:hypothetical protein
LPFLYLNQENNFAPLLIIVIKTRKFIPAKIIIHCPVDFANYWNSDPTSQIKDLFSGAEGNLLTISVKSPSDYTPVSEGDGLVIEDGLSSTYGSVETKRLGFRLKVRDYRTDLRIAIEELMELSVNYSCEEAIALTIDDYCYLKNREDRDRGYRIRKGFLNQSLQSLSSNIIPRGINQSVYDRYEKGFELSFIELERTTYY